MKKEALEILGCLTPKTTVEKLFAVAAILTLVWAEFRYYKAYHPSPMEMIVLGMFIIGLYALVMMTENKSKKEAKEDLR